MANSEQKYHIHHIMNRILLFAYITVPYYIFKSYWPLMEQKLPPEMVRNIFPGAVQFFTILTMFLFYGSLYYFNIPYFEKFKVNTLPWPWRVNKEKWKTQLKHLVWIYMRNFFLIGLLITALIEMTSSIRSSYKDFPSL